MKNTIDVMAKPIAIIGIMRIIIREYIQSKKIETVYPNCEINFTFIDQAPSQNIIGRMVKIENASY